MIVTLDYLDPKTFVLIFDDGTAKVAQQFYASPVTDAAIKSAAQQYVSAASSAKQAIVTMRVGDVVDTSVDITPVPAPTAVDLATAAFVQDYGLWRQHQKAIGLGVILPTDKRVIDLQARINAEWLDAYVSVL